MAGFYELQLMLLTGFCIFSLLAERYVSRSKRPLTGRTPDDHLESGKVGSASAVAQLARQYLTVYAIVMGASLVA